MTPSLDVDPHTGVDGQGGVNYHDRLTSRATNSFSAWAEPSTAFSIGQIILSYVSLSKADTLYLGSIMNTSCYQFSYSYGFFQNSTSYLANQYHLTSNQSSALSSVGQYAFWYLSAPLASAANPAVNSTFSVTNKAVKSAVNTVQNPTNTTPNSTSTPTTPTPSLSGHPHTGVDGQGGYTYFDSFTNRGIFAFSPWYEPSYSSAVGQINLGYLPISKADTFYSGSMVNTSRAQFYYHYIWFSEQATSYLANKFHLTVNQPSALSNVAYATFLFVDPPLASVANQSVSLPSVPDEKSTTSSATPTTPTPSLDGRPHTGADGQGESLYFDALTVRGLYAFSPYAHPLNAYYTAQTMLGYIPISKADTLYLGSIVNTSRFQFTYQSGWFQGSTSYLANQYHIAANYSSAVSSVSKGSFVSVGGPVASASVESVFLPSVSNVITTNSTPNSTKISTKPTPISTPNKSINTTNPVNNLEVVTSPEAQIYSEKSNKKSNRPTPSMDIRG